jgi:alkylation response protein AidB-like acyl-CoA dehydrogenase
VGSAKLTVSHPEPKGPLELGSVGGSLGSRELAIACSVPSLGVGVSMASLAACRVVPRLSATTESRSLHQPIILSLVWNC